MVKSTIVIVVFNYIYSKVILMKFLGAGLSRTGARSLDRAFKILGFKSIHFDSKRLNKVLFGEDTDPDSRVYDDIDVVTDIPSAYFYRELIQYYPDCKGYRSMVEEY